MSQTIWIARHANRHDFVKPEWFTKTANYRYDPPLSQDGFIQAKLLANRLKNMPIQHIFCSPFLRTIQTANAVAEVLDLPMKLEWGLSEWLNPEWMSKMPETRPKPWLNSFFPSIDFTYKSLPPSYPETEEQCLKRAGETAKFLAEKYPEDLLLVGHGVSIIGMVKGLIPLVNPQEIHPQLCAVVKLVNQGENWSMKLNGDTSHLQKIESSPRFY